MTVIVTEPIPNRNEFLQLLKINPGKIIFKFGAEWCVPCKKIESHVHNWFTQMPETSLCYVVDVDDSFDVAAFLKIKKVVVSYPTLLCYNKGNNEFYPDDTVVGADINQIDLFFKRCLDNDRKH